MSAGARLIFLVLMSISGMGRVFAAETIAPGLPEKLRVGVVEAAPFAMAFGAGTFEGVSIEMWQRAARSLGWSYSLASMDRETAIRHLETGELDVVIGDMPLSPDLLRRADCTVPYFSSDVGIAYKPRAKLGTARVLIRTFLSVGFLKVVLSMIGILVLVGGIILLIERGWRNEEFGQSKSHGALYGVYWAAAMMSGVGERTPTTARGRALALIWIFLGIFITSSFTAAITSNVTAEALADRAPTREDLPKLRVALLKGTFEGVLRQMGGRVVVVDSERAAIQAVIDGKADVCLGSETVLHYEVAKWFRDTLDVAPLSHRQTLQVFALRPNSALRTSLNRAMFEAAFSQEWLALRDKYRD